MDRATLEKYALILDDNDDDVFNIGLLLREQRFKINRAKSIADATQLFEQHTFEIIVVDMHLPLHNDARGIDGYYFIGYIRQKMDRGEIARKPIIAVSTEMSAIRQTRCSEVGADVIVEKPLSREALRTALSLDLSGTSVEPMLVEVAHDIVDFIRRTSHRSDDDGRLLLTMISPALHFSSEEERQAGQNILFQIGGKARVIQFLKDIYADLVGTPDDLDKLCLLLIHGASQEGILTTLKIGRRKFNSRVERITTLLTQKIYETVE